MGALLVYVFYQDAIWALYFSVFAASVSGFLTIFYLRWKGKTCLHDVRYEASVQRVSSNKTAKDIFSELIFVAIPFLMIAIFGYCDAIVNQIDLKPGLEAYGNMEYTAIVSTAVFGRATKIIAIPMVLAPGFSAAIIPYITAARGEKNYALVKKNITQCIESVLYMAIPVCFALCIFAQPIIFILFPRDVEGQLQLDTFIMKWYALEALSATICPVFSSIVMAIGCRKKIIRNTILFGFIKVMTNRLFITWWGVPGMVLSSVLAYAVFTVLNIYSIQGQYQVNWKSMLLNIVCMCVGVFGFYLVSLIFSSMGWIHAQDSKMASLLYLIISGSICSSAYLGITLLCNVPQSIFHFELRKLLHIRKKS